MTDFAVTQKAADFLSISSKFLAFPAETNFKADFSVNFTATHWYIVIGVVISYLLVVSVGSKIMESYKPYNLRLLLAAWNGFLCLFSFIGMFRTVPYLLASLLTETFENTVCSRPVDTWGHGPTGFWVMLFVASKIPELIDTVFIVARKRPLIFLHWYHHVTVLLFCWSAYSTMAGSGLYFVAMNFSVHALMYGYYCLQALKLCPKWFPTVWITLAQILQMFIGTGVCVACWYYKLSGKSCANDFSNLCAGGIMYGSYLYLFCEFAVKRYVLPQKPVKATKKLD